MKNFIVIYSLFFVLLLYSCLGGEDMPAGIQNGKEATITTDTVLNIGFNNATLVGTVSSQNGLEAHSRGFLIDTLELNDNSPKYDSGKGKGNFTKELTTLTVNKKYFVKAYATNDKGTSYGRVISFSTRDNKPTVISIPEVYNIIDGTAVCSGKLISEGNASIIEMGICWGTSENPTLENDSSTRTSQNSLNPFTVTLKKVKGGQKCYYRTFAKNNFGVGYGEVLSFDTPPIWEQLENFMGEERVFAATFVLNNDFYVATGGATTGVLNDSRMFQAGVNKWWSRETFIGSARKGAVGFSLDNNRFGFVGFGAGADGVAADNIYRYDRNENGWKMMEQRSMMHDGSIVRPLIYSSAFCLNNKAYVVGGITGSLHSSYTLYEIWEADLNSNNDTLKWMRKQNFPVEICKHITFTYKNNAFAGLGEEPNGTSKNRNIWVYDASKDTSNSITAPPAWSKFTTCPSEFKFGDLGSGTRVAVSVTGNGKAYFMGKQTIWELNLETKEWAKKSDAPGRSYGNIMFAIGNTVYVGINIDSREFYRYQPLWDN